MDKDKNIKGSRGRGVLIVFFLNITIYREYRDEKRRNTYIYPKYNLRFNTMLNPNSTSMSPIPNGFFIILATIRMNTQTIIPPMIAFSGIEWFKSVNIKKYNIENIKYVFISILGTSLYIRSKYEKQKKNISTA